MLIKKQKRRHHECLKIWQQSLHEYTAGSHQYTYFSENKMAEGEMDSLLMSLIEKEIPDGRNALKDSHKNLAVLSDYCKENYINKYVIL